MAKPKKYVMKFKPVEAMRFNGDEKYTKDILAWLTAHEVTAEYTPPQIVKTPEHDQPDLEIKGEIRIYESPESPMWNVVELDWYIVKDTDGEFYAVPGEEFENNFRAYHGAEVTSAIKENGRIAGLNVALEGVKERTTFLRLRHADE